MMRWTRVPEPVVLPPEVEVTTSEWEVRLHGIRIGTVYVSGGQFLTRNARGFTHPNGRYSTRDEAVAGLIEQARQ